MKIKTPKTTKRMLPFEITKAWLMYSRMLELARTESAKKKVIMPKSEKAQTVAMQNVLKRPFMMSPPIVHIPR